MKRIAAVVMIAWAAVAWTPGGDYPGTGTRTNAVYDPYLGSILPWSQNVQVVGRIATNDVAVFTDRSGRYLRGTNLAALAATTAALTNEAALRAAGDAEGSNYVTLATAGLAAHTSSAAIHLTAGQSARIAAALTNESDTAALATISTQRIERVYRPGTTGAVWTVFGLAGTQTTYTVSSEVIATAVVFSPEFQSATADRPPLDVYEYNGIELVVGSFTLQTVFGGFSLAHTDGSLWQGGWVSVDPEVMYPSTLNPDNATSYGTVYIGPYTHLTTNTIVRVVPSGQQISDWNSGTNTAAEALLTANTATGTVNNHVFSTNPHAGYVVTPQGLTNAMQAAPVWIGRTNLTGSVTLTNNYERPQYLYATGAVTVAFAGLRAPQPVYVVVRGASSLAFAGAYVVGGGNWQTNMSNHFVVWAWGTNTLVNPVTATED